jgi:hypothetical protein
MHGEIVRIKHLKFAPTCFGLFWSHLQLVHGRTFLGYWIGMLIYICYKESLYVAICKFIPSLCVCVWGGGGVLVEAFSILKCSEVHELEK